MNNKLIRKQRRAKSKRFRIKEQSPDRPRLCVHKTLQNIYVQLISACGTKTLASASTGESEFRGQYGGNCDAATKIGKLIAQRAQDCGVSKVAFDSSGCCYHGRVKALAEAAREGGLDF